MIFPIKIFLKEKGEKNTLWISKVSSFETLSKVSYSSFMGVKQKSGYDPSLVFGMMRSLWMDRFVRRCRSTTNEQFRWNRVRLLSLLPSLSLFRTLSLNFLLFLSVCLSLLSVCLSLFLCLSLSSNLRLDLLNPHTIHLTYTFIRIKTRW